MGDKYIDYDEVEEYGGHLSTMVPRLFGVSPLVNMEAVKAEVDAKVAAVQVELEKAGLVRSVVRGAAGDIEEQTAKGKKLIEQFFNYLGALDEDVPVDREAFFPGGNKGELSRLTASSAAARMAGILRGFAVPSNAALPEGASWKARFEQARAGLVQTSGDRGGARGDSIVATAELVAARDGFVKFYNGVAKRLVLGALNHVGRAGEYKLFFKDLQVTEPRTSPSGSGEPVSEAPAPPEPVDA